MSFSCYLHGWTHLENPCPICHKVTLVSSGSAGGAVINSEQNTFEQLQKENAALKNLVRELMPLLNGEGMDGDNFSTWIARAKELLNEGDK